MSSDNRFPLRRRALAPLAAALAASLAFPLGAHAEQSAAGTQQKVLRYAFRTAETGFDPAQISDIYSRSVTPHIFESLYGYDPLARPAKIRPLTAQGMPEVSSDFKVWTVRIRPGIYFSDDPAFKGRKRELVAADYVYSFKRFYDPKFKSANYSSMQEEGILGLEELRQDVLKNKKPFDYDREVEGLRAIDRYTLQIKLAEGRPRFLGVLAGCDLMGAVAREVVEAYPDTVMEHPVGTGPFVLRQWRRSSLIVLERNPSFRHMVYEAEPEKNDAQGQAILAKLKGRTLPMVDRVEISIIDEPQPRWLSFLDRQFDLVQIVPIEFGNIAVPNGKLAPNLASQGITMDRVVNPDSYMTVFNMEDPVVGGYEPAKVALRRALGLAYDVDREIRLVQRNQAVPAQSAVVPHTSGFDPEYRGEGFDLARAKALLDLYGYVDRDGDGWREQPDGSPLVLEIASSPDQTYRALAELRKKAYDALGVKLDVKVSQWAEQLRAARAGKYQMWFVGSSAASADGQGSLERAYGPASGGANLSRFRLAAFDQVYDHMKVLPDGPERNALFTQAKMLIDAYAPYKYHVHRIVTDLSQPWLVGYRRPLFWQEFWQYVDIDTAKLPH